MQVRLNAVFTALLYSSALWGTSFAEELDDLEESSTTTSPTSTATVNRPQFTPTSIKAPFYEQFTDDWKSRWTVSRAKKVNDKTDTEEWAYVGQWAVEEPVALKGIEGDKGLVVKNVAAHHAISAKFDKPIDNTGKTLVVQYEVKLQNGLDCGGAYLKLLKDNAALHAEEFSNASPYVIMFGPDKCGATNKVHFIFKHKNPNTGEYEEKHLKNPPMARISKHTTLYTLIVNPDQTFEIKMDGNRVKNGTLLEDFNPPVNPPKEIDDKDDKKPNDWVDDPKIPDPDAKKPDDWDEDAPYEIVDENAVKPEDWLEDEPEYIPDPEAQKPEDWDDEEDGDWLAPTIPNPKCAEVSGCGKWEKPMIPNPAYKGKWRAPLIDNPAYKGAWAPRKIPNPDYFEDKTPANFEPMGAVGFELWTMSNNILFDNIYIGHSVKDAEELQKKTFDIKKKIELEEEALQTPKPELPKDDKAPFSFKEDPLAYIKFKLELFLATVQKDPVGAVKAFPETAGGIFAVFATLFAVLAGLISMASAPAKVTKAPAQKKAAEEKKAPTPAKKEAASSSSEDEKKKTTRRTTRKAE
ncbi:Calreticulin family-domain-containing protein [Kalaharituber pfeilii]|nr:Calreticulin family-domain-containing protein [Kalaharituber pfeilii]